MNIQILPSLLAADVGALGAEIARVARSGADALHLDVMDAHFVPNLSFGPDVVALARRVAPGLFRNVHLMMTRPGLYLAAFARAGARPIQVHVETPVGRVFPYLKACDELLVMTVHPGYGGQTFIADCLAKVTAVRARAPHLDVMVDGGVNAETAVLAARAGANQFVAGSYLFRQADMAAAVAALRAACAAALPA